MFRIFLASLFFVSNSWAGLPPTTLKGQKETGRPTTFNFQVPQHQAVTVGSNTRLIETGNTNLLRNGGLEGTTVNWVQYTDAASARPEDGTGGGAANVTCTRTTSSPLSGVASLLIDKDSGNRQGKGCSLDFTIDVKDQAKVLKIEADYIVSSGTFVAGDPSDRTTAGDSSLVFYLYDDDNDDLIEPSTIRLYSNSTTISDKFSAYFQTSAAATNYRLIAHVARDDTAAWAVKLDNISVSPSEYVYGTPITDWVSYSPTITHSSGEATNYNKPSFWRRVGQNIEVVSNITFTGAVGTWADFRVRIPDGLSFDTTVSEGEPLGTGTIIIGGATYNTQIVRITASNAFAPRLYTIATHSGTVYTGHTAPTQAAPDTFASGSIIRIKATHPISGWSSSVQMSDSADTRVVAARANTTATTTIGAEADFIPATTVFDTHGSYSSSTGYTVRVPGKYRVTLNYVTSTYSTASTLVGRIQKNGTTFANSTTINPAANGQYTVHVSALVDCVAGDILKGRFLVTAGTPTLSGTAADNYLEIERISGPSAIAATETIAVGRRRSTSNQTGVNPANSTVVIQLNGAETFDRDTHAGWDNTNFRYTVPAAGLYHISASVRVDSTNVLANLYRLDFRINGTLAQALDTQIRTADQSFNLHGDTYAWLTAGQLVDFGLFGAGDNNSGNPLTILSSGMTRARIVRIGL
jgi:hypothetical protein